MLRSAGRPSPVALFLVMLCVVVVFLAGVHIGMALGSETASGATAGAAVRSTRNSVETALPSMEAASPPLSPREMSPSPSPRLASGARANRAPLPVLRPEPRVESRDFERSVANYQFEGFHAADVRKVSELLDMRTMLGPAFWVFEVGALDGVKDGSISHFFETAAGWTTVLMEANAVNFERLRVNRPNAILVQGAICGWDNKDGTLEFLGDFGGSVGAVKTMDPVHRKTFHGARDDTYTVRCEALGPTLRDVGVPHLDLFSLDVEGAELVALDSMDWNIPVRFLLIEMNKLDLPRDAVIEAKLRALGFRLEGWVSSLNQLWVNDAFGELMAAKAKRGAGRI